MLPAGYMYKTVVRAPDAVHGPADIYSVSGCISPYFSEYIPYWRHNGLWFFDRPDIMHEIARSHAIDLSGMTLFYYELAEDQYDEATRRWAPLQLDLPFPTDVQVPATKRLVGYDVVTFSCGTSPECSPLSCNDLAPRIGVNAHCLLESLQRAKDSLDAGHFAGSEPGPFRVL